MSKVAAHVIGVKQVKTEELEPNPHNPRRLFDKLPLQTLQESIALVGILVPLTVYQDSKSKRYVILDGQRRWMCASALKLKTVPVNEVQEPTLVQNIVTMFQIHKLREDWELMPTALKLELLMRETNDSNNKRVAALTGLDEAVVVRCKKLLSYESKYQEMMLDSNPEQRTKADFFIELYPVRHDRNVQKFDWFKPVKFTDQMIQKVEAGGLRAVTDFRIVKQHINNAVKANRVQTISRKLKDFAETPNARVDALEVQTAKSHALALTLTKDVRKLMEQLDDIQVDEMYGEKEMWDTMEKLMGRIRSLLLKADRRVRE
ncbi:MAG: ParB/RepB/Spo0J family partition protein [Tepidisphaeraceae bacterium]